VTYIAIARMENYYEGSQERNTVATEIGSTPKRSDVTGEKSRASLMIRFWCFSCGSHSSQCKLHRWLQDSRVGFAIHCKAKGRKSESVIRLPYKIFRSDHTVPKWIAQWIHNRNKFSHPTVHMLLPYSCLHEIERTALQSVDNIRKTLFIRANFRVR